MEALIRFLTQVASSAIVSTAAITNGNAGANFSINNFLNNMKSSLEGWGSILVIIIGLVMVIVAVFKIGKGLMSGGRAQTNWVLNILLFFIGGALAFSGGWGLVQNVSGGGTKTMYELGGMSTVMLQHVRLLLGK